MRPMLIGSRGSKLALAQANEIVTRLRAVSTGLSCKVIPIKTKGDKLGESGEDSSEGKRIFTKEIEDSLLKAEIQIAVHSMKDLTTVLPAGLTIGAVPPRADHRDALISRRGVKFDKLPAGARIGTSSPRRRTQLLSARNDLQVMDAHGNVDTRLRKLNGGEYDAIILAAAGLIRLDLESSATELLSTKVMLPAIGQGALAVEIREDDAETRQLVSRIDDQSTRRATEAERAFAKRLGANCRTPIAAYATVRERKLTIDGMVSSMDGHMLLRSRLVSDDADSERAGEGLAESLLQQGAQVVLEAA